MSRLRFRYSRARAAWRMAAPGCRGAEGERDACLVTDVLEQRQRLREQPRAAPGRPRTGPGCPCSRGCRRRPPGRGSPGTARSCPLDQMRLAHPPGGDDGADGELPERAGSCAAAPRRASASASRSRCRASPVRRCDQATQASACAAEASAISRPGPCGRRPWRSGTPSGPGGVLADPGLDPGEEPGPGDRRRVAESPGLLQRLNGVRVVLADPGPAHLEANAPSSASTRAADGRSGGPQRGHQPLDDPRRSCRAAPVRPQRRGQGRAARPGSVSCRVLSAALEIGLVGGDAGRTSAGGRGRRSARRPPWPG